MYSVYKRDYKPSRFSWQGTKVQGIQGDLMALIALKFQRIGNRYRRW